MNHMKRIATEILGLEWDEVKGESETFEVGSTHEKCKLLKDYMAYLDSEGRWTSIYDGTTLRVLTGDIAIKKLPKKWKPNCGQFYFVPCLDDTDLYSETRWNKELVDGDELDNHRYENNLVFQTKEQAIEESKRILRLRLEESK